MYEGDPALVDVHGNDAVVLGEKASEGKAYVTQAHYGYCHLAPLPITFLEFKIRAKHLKYIRHWLELELYSSWGFGLIAAFV